MTFQRRQFFVINKENWLSLHLIPTCILSCSLVSCLQTCCLEKRGKQQSGNEWETPQEKDRQTDRGMTGGTFHRVSHGKLLGTLTGRAAFRTTQPALQSHPLSLLNFYWIWNVKRRGTYALSHSSLFLSFPSCLPLSVRGRVCHATGARQTVDADKINFLMLIPVGTKNTLREKK